MYNIEFYEDSNGRSRTLNDTFVLLHQFRKKTQKTPKREIERVNVLLLDLARENLLLCVVFHNHP